MIEPPPQPADSFRNSIHFQIPPSGARVMSARPYELDDLQIFRFPRPLYSMFALPDYVPFVVRCGHDK